MDPDVITYIQVSAIILVCIMVIISSIITISNIVKIRKDMHQIWLNSQSFQMARMYEFMGENDKAVLCYKETLFNVINKKYRIPKMNKKLQVEFLVYKIIRLGGSLPDLY